MTSETDTARVSRRGFIARAAAGLAAASPLLRSAARAGSTEPLPETLIGSNSFAWGQYARREKRKLVPTDVMSTLRDLGYDFLEMGVSPERPEEVSQLASQMRERGLRTFSVYTEGAFYEAGPADEAADKLLALGRICSREGFHVMVCNPAPKHPVREKTDAELGIQAAALSKLGAGLKALGMKLGIHNHLPTMGVNGREFRSNFDRTKPSEVGMCYDVHWVWKGGLMPSEVLPAYGDRITNYHIRQSRGRIWWEDLDTGDIDYSEFARYVRQHRLCRKFEVELALEAKTKITRSVAENHRRSIEFVRRVFGA